MWRGAVQLLLWLALSAALLVPGLLAGPSLDASVFMVLGWQLGEGAVPYVDVWDHKPPGIYVVNAGADRLLGWADPWFAAWTVTVVAVALTGLQVTTVLRRAGQVRFAALSGAAAVGGLSHYLLSLGGGLTEQLAVLPAAVAIGLVVRLSPLRSWFGAGCLLGVAGLISLQLAPAGVACLGLAAFEPGSRRLAAAGLLVIGTASVFAVTGVALAALGGLGPALDAVVTYTVAYRAVGGAHVVSLAAWSFLSLLFLVIGAAFGILSLRRAPPAIRKLGFASLIWITGSIALVLAADRLYGHYVAPMAVPLAMLTAIGLQDVASGPISGSPGRLVVVGALVAGVVISAAVAVGGGSMEYSVITRNQAAAREVSAFLRRHAEPAATLFVWGNRPALYRFAEMDPATAYVYLYPITTHDYADENLVAKVLADLQTTEPQFVVDAGAVAQGEPGFPPLLIERPVRTDGRDLDLLDPLRGYVERHYQRLGIVAGWVVYVRHSAP